jgi:succinate dehydrogenase/fumarate reductase flavoprotein subunit
MIVPLLKDYNGPACAYVAGPYGGYTATPDGQRLTSNDYWSGELIMHMHHAQQQGDWPAFLKLDHLPEKDIAFIEHVLHSNERPSRDRFHRHRGTDYRHRMLEMSLSEPSLCSGHSASGILVDANAQTTLKGLFAAGDVASVPHQYLLGAFVIGKLAGESAALYAQHTSPAMPDPSQIEEEYERVFRPLQVSGGYHHEEVEYKIRRTFSQYSTPPKSENMMNLGLERLHDIRMHDISMLSAKDPHELGRTLEVPCILDCAEMSTMSSLYRKESRWGFLHYRLDYPSRDDVNGLYRTIVHRSTTGDITVGQIPVPDPLISAKLPAESASK